MGVGDFLFGEGPETEYRTMELWKPWQNLLAEGRGGLADFLGRPWTDFPMMGDMPGVKMSLQGYEDIIRQLYGGGKGQIADVRTGMYDALNRLLTGTPEDFEQYYQSTIVDPLTEQFREDILPGISRKYAPSGFWSSQRLESEREATQDLTEMLSRGRAEYGYKARESALDRMLKASELSAMMPGVEGQTLAAMLGLGKEAFGMGPGEGFMRELQRMSMIMQALGLRGLENIVTTTGGTSGILGNLISAAGMLGGGYLAGRK